MGLECPNKLYFTGKEEYANNKTEDSFLEALAQGGFQVEELARLSYPRGILIKGDDWDYENLHCQTQELLKQENIIIYEAAFLVNGLFIRTDILVKKGDVVELIEVKAKSYQPDDEYIFVGKRGNIVKSWKPYLFDIAFQKYVMQLCFSNWRISSFIMMADKTKKASIDGLNQLFRINKKAGNRTGITKKVQSINEIGDSVLSRKNVSNIIEDIEGNKHRYFKELTFIETIDFLKEHFQKDKYANWPTSYSSCKNCEFKTDELQEKLSLKSGYKLCFQRQHNWRDIDFERPKTFDVWNFRKGEKLFEDGIYFMDELSEDIINYKEEAGGLSVTERQWLQIEKEINGDTSFYVDVEGIAQEVNNWIYPYHFIDFETSAVALPFNKGNKPYGQVAFQFSHHIYHENGKIEHDSEYINNKSGFFPNFEFIRSLQASLGNDNGTIFRYSHHENTILNAIRTQLENSDEGDKEELIDFIQSISHSVGDRSKKWQGNRDMVDLWELIKKYYYNPLTKGSNSIKDVLPAALSSSSFLRTKYSKPIGQINVTSRNFAPNHIWLSNVDGKVLSPYKMLPKVFDDWDERQIEYTLSDVVDITDGGAALMAYAKLQYSDMKQDEVNEITSALLKYCELDTLAMVMIFEHLKEDIINQN